MNGIDVPINVGLGNGLHGPPEIMITLVIPGGDSGVRLCQIEHRKEASFVFVPIEP